MLERLGLLPELAEKAELYRALGDETRLRILILVRRQSACVRDLVDALEMPQGTVSHHLAILLRAGLVSATRQGRENYYQATLIANRPPSVF